MANYDKYDPKAGGFRAALAADWPSSDLKKVFGVSLNASGQVVKGSGGSSGMVGVIVMTQALKAGDIVDVMTAGEIVDFGGNAGTKYFAAAADGAVNATSAAGKYLVGATAKGDRLIVRFNSTPVA